MVRAKPKKKKMVDTSEIKQIAIKCIDRERDRLKQECMDEIMSLIMPVVMLACKDEFHLDQSQLDAVSKRADRYFGHIADGSVDIDQLHELMEAREG